LEAQLFDEPLVVLCEPVRLQQIVWNLLSNAIKFTEAGGRVRVRTEKDGQNASVIVEDTGIGIAPDFLPHVFDRFRQADGSRTRRHGGLGLGLAIVQALAKLHGGSVRAESEGVGQGSRFIFTLPLAGTENFVDENEEHHLPSEVNQQVLIVEDSPDTLLLLCTLFEQKGCRIMPATSGEEALRLALANRPTIIVSDIGMPNMDGYDLLTNLRRLPGLSDVPAIAISGYAMEEDRERATAAGFVAHLAKPVNVEELFALIQKLTS